jgi:hypothetical protein
MASTSTNKQPALIDRPLFNVISLGEAAALATAANLRTPLPAGLKELVNPGTDGCFVDSVTVIAPEGTLTASKVVLFASRITTPSGLNPFNCYPVGWAAVDSSSVGARVNVPLLPLSVPVPNLASPAATTEGYPSEVQKKNTGLMLPGDWRLYAGTDVILQSALGPSQVVVVVQGGHY